MALDGQKSTSHFFVNENQANGFRPILHSVVFVDVATCMYKLSIDFNRMLLCYLAVYAI